MIQVFCFRYEDICLKRLEYAEQIYRFAGLRMTSEMKDWIVSNTEVSILICSEYTIFPVFEVFDKRVPERVDTERSVNN